MCCKAIPVIETLQAEGEVEIISGGARGADMLAETLAKKLKLPFTKYPADWGGLGLKAGFVRNDQMTDVCNALISFWNGKSKGTKHAIDSALKKKKEVHVFNYECIEG